MKTFLTYVHISYMTYIHSGTNWNLIISHTVSHWNPLEPMQQTYMNMHITRPNPSVNASCSSCTWWPWSEFHGGGTPPPTSTNGVSPAGQNDPYQGWHVILSPLSSLQWQPRSQWRAAAPARQRSSRWRIVAFLPKPHSISATLQPTHYQAVCWKALSGYSTLILLL
jgi:hypothetical protein